MDKVVDIIKKIMTALMCLMTGIDVIMIVLSVIYRYIFKISINWVSEVAGISLVWVTFLGAVVATFDESNLAFSGFIDHWQGKAKFVAKLLVNCLILVMIYVLIRYGLKTMFGSMGIRLVSVKAPLGFAVSVIPFSGIFMCIAVIVNIIRDFRKYVLGIEEKQADLSLYDEVPEEVLKKANEAIDTGESRSADGGKDGEEG